MTDTLCAHCQTIVIEGMPICPACGGDLSTPAMPANPTLAEPPPSLSAEAPPSLSAELQPDEVVCSGCGHPNRIHDRPYCERCLTPLAVSLASRPAPAASPTSAEIGNARLVFMNGTEVQLCPGKQIMLGRDLLQSPVGVSLAQFDAVSRKHATVGRSSTGAAWVRDEGSTNGTFVNGRPVPANTTMPLRPGDELRLCSDVTARFEDS